MTMTRPVTRQRFTPDQPRIGWHHLVYFGLGVGLGGGLSCCVEPPPLFCGGSKLPLPPSFLPPLLPVLPPLWLPLLSLSLLLSLDFVLSFFADLSLSWAFSVITALAENGNGPL